MAGAGSGTRPGHGGVSAPTADRTGPASTYDRTEHTDSVLAAFNRHAGAVPVVGGLASAGPRPHSNALVLNDWHAGRSYEFGQPAADTLRLDPA